MGACLLSGPAPRSRRGHRGGGGGAVLPRSAGAALARHGELPSGALAIGSPYDTEARYGVKRGVGWRGYKAYFTETCEPNRPHLIAHVATTAATTADVDTIGARHADLAKADLLPDQHLVDAGRVSVDHILAARADHSVELVGPLPPDSGWQARDEHGFDLTRFHIDWDGKLVTCPTGKTSRNWRQTTSRQGVAHHPAPTLRASDRTPALIESAALPRQSWPVSSPSDPRPIRGPAAAAHRAGHRRLAGPLRAPLRDRGHHRPGLPPQRLPPRPLPPPGQDPPATRPDRAGTQPRPPRRLAHQHPTGRQLGLPPHQTPTPTLACVNSAAESLRRQAQPPYGVTWAATTAGDQLPGPSPDAPERPGDLNEMAAGPLSNSLLPVSPAPRARRRSACAPPAATAAGWRARRRSPARALSQPLTPRPLPWSC